MSAKSTPEVPECESGEHPPRTTRARRCPEGFAAPTPSAAAAMNFSTKHLKRYREIARLFWKYGRTDLTKYVSIDGQQVDQEHFKRTDAAANGEAAPGQLADDL